MTRLAVALLSLLAMVHGITMIDSDEAFEHKIIQDKHAWAVLFVSKHREDPEVDKVVALAADSMKLQVAIADVEVVKAFASEFNVRKRMVPRLLLFNSRARQAEIIKPLDQDGKAKAAEVIASEMHGHLQENVIGVDETDGNEKYVKTTLAIGGGEKEDL